MAYLIGVDLGTSGTKGTGRLVARREDQHFRCDLAERRGPG